MTRPNNPARGRMGWHDVTSHVRGPAVADISHHVTQRWLAVTAERLETHAADRGSPGQVDLQIVRTVPENLYDFAPHGDFRIIEAYLRALRSAPHLMYLENQFLWSPEITQILADKLRRPPTDEFRVVIMLPAKADNGEDDTQGQLGLLAHADGGQNRFSRPRSGRTRETPATVCTCTRKSGSSTTAGSQRQRHNRGEPMTHKLVQLPATSRRSKRLLGPLQALLVDG